MPSGEYPPQVPIVFLGGEKQLSVLLSVNDTVTRYQVHHITPPPPPPSPYRFVCVCLASFNPNNQTTLHCSLLVFVLISSSHLSPLLPSHLVLSSNM